MRAEENCALIFKKDCSTKFFQCFSFYSTLSRANVWALFLFLLLVKGEIEGVVSTMIVDLNGISMCKAIIRISLIHARLYGRYWPWRQRCVMWRSLFLCCWSFSRFPSLKRFDKVFIHWEIQRRHRGSGVTWVLPPQHFDFNSTSWEVAIIGKQHRFVVSPICFSQCVHLLYKPDFNHFLENPRIHQPISPIFAVLRS